MSVDIGERHVPPAPVLDDEGAIAPLGLPTPRTPAPTAGQASRPRRPVSGRAITATAFAAVVGAIALVVMLSGGQSAPPAVQVRAGAFTTPLQNLSTSLTQSLERIQATDQAAARLRAAKRKLLAKRHARAYRRAVVQRHAAQRRAAARRRAAAGSRPPARSAPAPTPRPATPPPPPPPADEFPF